MPLRERQINRIIELRKKGFSIPEISKECDISKSTVLRKTKNVEILPAFYSRWLERRNASKIISERNWKIAELKAEEKIHKLDKTNLALIGAVLYWAEGAKKDLSFMNSDSEMIKIFIRILRKIYGVKNSDFLVSIRIYGDLKKEDCLKYWSKITGIKLGEKTSIEIINSRKNGKLKYGMCRVRVKKGGMLLKELFSIIKRINLLV